MVLLVVGGTGPLAPAVSELAGRGEDTVIVSRTPGPGKVVADWADPEAMAGALVGRHFDGALIYAPGAPLASLAAAVAAVDGPSVLLLTTAWAAPGAPAPRDRLARAGVADAVLVRLGWASADGEGTRWHSPAEISRAAVDALTERADTTLGHLRPWSDLPRD